MNVFVPYQSPIECAKALWNDQKRFNKQIIECGQILKAISGETKAWGNHPCTKMYKPYVDWLYFYTKCLESYRRYKKSKDKSLDALVSIKDAKDCSFISDSIRPPFLTDEFCDQHKRRLYTKAKELYPQFAQYGTSDINYYVVNGELLKYKDGKRIKE